MKVMLPTRSNVEAAEAMSWLASGEGPVAMGCGSASCGSQPTAQANICPQTIWNRFVGEGFCGRNFCPDNPPLQ